MRRSDTAARELLSLITASGAVTDSSYELIEYINDVNREYAEVLAEQNINGTRALTFNNAEV